MTRAIIRQAVVATALLMAILSTPVLGSPVAAISIPQEAERPADRLVMPLHRTWQPSLAPFAHVRFCVQNPAQCKRSRVSIRKPVIVLTKQRLDELARVNRTVNHAIRPTSTLEGPLGDTWNLSPKAGDCDDYAVTKRAQLLAAGWPSNALLLTHVVVGGENHLVLTVRMRGVDVVLDNLNPAVRAISLERSPIVRIQSPFDPNMWLKPLDTLPVISRRKGDQGA